MTSHSLDAKDFEAVIELSMLKIFLFISYEVLGKIKLRQLNQRCMSNLKIGTDIFPNFTEENIETLLNHHNQII